MCPTLQDESQEQANAMGNFSGPQRKYDPYSSTLRSGKELEIPAVKKCGRDLVLEDEVEKVKLPNDVILKKPNILEIEPPFPQRFANSKKEMEEKEILDIFRKVEINIPLLDA